ncbi:exported hypothetical protein [Xanthomonas citri pv. citri]|nr:exported hypothetical protein [Xanthomonas citri pv. citri]
MRVFCNCATSFLRCSSCAVTTASSLRALARSASAAARKAIWGTCLRWRLSSCACWACINSWRARLTRSGAYWSASAWVARCTACSAAVSSGATWAAAGEERTMKQAMPYRDRRKYAKLAVIRGAVARSLEHGHCRKPAADLQRDAAVCWGTIAHGYRLLPEADDRKECLGHVLDHRRAGVHQDRRQALPARQYGVAAGDGQENRLLVDGRRPGTAVRARARAQHGHRPAGRRPLPRERIQAARRGGHGDSRHSQPDSQHRRAQPAAGAQGRHHDPARAGAGGGFDRLGQVDLAGVDDRPPQQHHHRAHPHHRGPDRISAQTQDVDREPARGGPGHPRLPERAEERHARGAGRDSDRRDPGRRNHGGGDRLRRNRPPVPGHAALQQCRPDHRAHPQFLPGKRAQERVDEPGAEPARGHFPAFGQGRGRPSSTGHRSAAQHADDPRPAAPRPSARGQAGDGRVAGRRHADLRPMPVPDGEVGRNRAGRSAARCRLARRPGPEVPSFRRRLRRARPVRGLRSGRGTEDQPRVHLIGSAAVIGDLAAPGLLALVFQGDSATGPSFAMPMRQAPSSGAGRHLLPLAGEGKIGSLPLAGEGKIGGP